MLFRSAPVSLQRVSEFAYSVQGNSKQRLDVSMSCPCFVCLDAPRNAILFECGHGGLCVACGISLQSDDARCPLCRANFEMVLGIVEEDAASGAARVRVVSYVPVGGGLGAV